jgi:hypothetical protein
VDRPVDTGMNAKMVAGEDEMDGKANLLRNWLESMDRDLRRTYVMGCM